MAEGGVEWELCKENIQPLRRGRAMSVLQRALCQQEDGGAAATQQQRQAFESELRLYDGDDPLDVWVRYIDWARQAFPQGGRESNVPVLLERATAHFANHTEYYNDARYVSLWVEFAEGRSDPMDVFRYLQAQGIGTMRAELYISWAEQHEARGDLKKADAVFQEGIRCRAQPQDRLLRFHRELQARVCRLMMSSVSDQQQQQQDDDDDDEGVAELERVSLSELRSRGKRVAVAPIDRAKASLGYARGLQLKPLAPPQNQRLLIFDENHPGQSAAPQPRPEAWMAPPAARAKENQQKAGKWSGVKLHRKSRFRAAAPGPSFQPYQEEDETQPDTTPCKINPAMNPVLSARKPSQPDQTPFRPQRVDEEPLENGSRSMYCKQLLNSGASEFCFEELRAERHFQRQKTLHATADSTTIP